MTTNTLPVAGTSSSTNRRSIEPSLSLIAVLLLKLLFLWSKAICRFVRQLLRNSWKLTLDNLVLVTVAPIMIGCEYYLWRLAEMTQATDGLCALTWAMAIGVAGSITSGLVKYYERGTVTTPGKKFCSQASTDLLAASLIVVAICTAVSAYAVYR